MALHFFQVGVQLNALIRTIRYYLYFIMAKYYTQSRTGVPGNHNRSNIIYASNSSLRSNRWCLKVLCLISTFELSGRI